MSVDINFTSQYSRDLLKRYVSVNLLRKGALSVDIYRNACVFHRPDSTDCVITENQEVVKKSLMREDEVCRIKEGDVHTAKKKEGTVIYIGAFPNVWGHIITDGLKKLWYLDTAEYSKLRQKGAKVVYVASDNIPIDAYRELFYLAGCNFDDFECITEPTIFSNVIVPDNSFVYDSETNMRYYYKEFIATVNQIKCGVNKCYRGGGNTIYLTRTKLVGQRNVRDFGEESLEKFFREQEFEVIAPEKYSVTEQIYMYMHCKSFAATEGSISHNSMFCDSNAEVLLLMKNNYVNLYTLAINQLANLNVKYIEVNHTIKDNTPWLGPFFLCVTSQLAGWAGTRVSFLPYWLSKTYFRYLCAASKKHDVFYLARIKGRIKALIRKIHKH